MYQVDIEINAAVTPDEVIAARENPPGEEQLWQNCLNESLCVVTARDRVSRRLLGIGFLVGNSRHAQLADITVHSSARKQGIGGQIVDKLVQYAKQRQIRYFGLTYDPSSPWLKGFYERHGFRSINFAMWEGNCLNAVNPK